LAPSFPATCLNLVLIFLPSSPPNYFALESPIPNISFIPLPPKNPSFFLSSYELFPIFLPVLIPPLPFPLNI